MASVAASRSRARAAPKGRSLWWVVHSWTGLKLGIFLTWILLTGTLAVFSSEMDWLARPALRVMPHDAPMASWGTLAAAASKAAAQAAPGARLTMIAAPPHAWFAAEAQVQQGKKRPVRIYLNPYSGQVQGIGQWRSFQRFFREMHRHLLLPARIGIPIVSSLSILILLSLVTGLVTYKKFWRGFFRWPSFRRNRAGNARRLTGDLHRLGGLWSLWFVALIGLTGFWYLVESLGGEASYPKPPKVQVTASVSPVEAAQIDRFADMARRAYPSLVIRELRLPDKPQEPIGFFGQGDAMLVRDRVNGVWIDPVRGQVLNVVKGETLNAHQRISEMSDPLHFGTWGGMATKLIWFLFGAMLTGLSVTGVMICSLRLKTAYADQITAQARLSGPMGRAWRAMGVFAYPATAMILLALALLPGWLMAD